VTDTATNTTMAELEARLAELEARIGPAPQAVPPVTIGELTDVPAPGAPVASQWATEVTRRSVHRFATVAARDTAYPAASAGPGAVCITLDTGTVWVVFGATWTRYKPSQGTPFGLTFYSAVQSGNVALTTSATVNLAVNLPAMPAGTMLDVSFQAYVNCGAVGTGGGQAFMDYGGNPFGQIGAIWADRVMLDTYSVRCIPAPVPIVGDPFTLSMKGVKFSAGGSVQLQTSNTAIIVAAYTP
jgi:hypothetical protein